MSEKRFAFGKNWKRYLNGVGSEEIDAACKSLAQLGPAGVAQASFLDIGSGSGLFSRAAYQLGYEPIVSFDYDQDSVEATMRMKEVTASNDSQWRVMQGSVLDVDFMKQLGSFDVVYSWGVLHHTGAMWLAIENAANAVKPSGQLYLAIYNDQGWISTYWLAVKRAYIHSPPPIRFLLLSAFWTFYGVTLFWADILRLRNPLKRHTGDSRGMKFFTDVVDWVGGYPFEVSTPERIERFLNERGFGLHWKRIVGRRHGCNEFIFRRRPADE